MWAPYKDPLFIMMAGALALALTAVVVLLPSTANNSSDKQNEQQNAHRSNCDSLLRSFGYSIATESGKPKDGSEDQKAHADLCQQLRMAKAAEDAAETSLHQFWLSFANLIFLIVATAAAVLAARWAGTASKQAKRGADAGFEMNKIAREISVAENRAWISLTGMDVKFTESAPGRYGINIQTRTSNIGAYPATKVRERIEFCDVRFVFDRSAATELARSIAHQRGPLHDEMVTTMPPKLTVSGGQIGPAPQQALGATGQPTEIFGVIVVITYMPRAGESEKISSIGAFVVPEKTADGRLAAMEARVNFAKNSVLIE